MSPNCLTQGKHKFSKVRKKAGCFASRYTCLMTHELSDSSITGLCLTKFFDKNDHSLQSIPFIYLQILYNKTSKLLTSIIIRGRETIGHEVSYKVTPPAQSSSPFTKIQKT